MEEYMTFMENSDYIRSHIIAQSEGDRKFSGVCQAIGKAMVFYVVIQTFKTGLEERVDIGVQPLTEAIRKAVGIEEEQLYELAVSNLKRLAMTVPSLERVLRTLPGLEIGPVTGAAKRSHRR